LNINSKLPQNPKIVKCTTLELAIGAPAYVLQISC